MTDAKHSFTPLTAHGADPLRGRLVTPGDTAISQRALLLAALAVGASTIRGMRASQDVLTTATALRQMGVRIDQTGNDWQVHGLGVAGLLEPAGREQHAHAQGPGGGPPLAQASRRNRHGELLCR